MENKKGAYGNPANTPTNEILANEAIPKHVHNTAPQHLRLLQYGLKIPNHQHTQVTNQQSLHHHLNRSVTPHLHQYQPQVVQYQQLSHLQHSPHQHHQFQLPLGVYQNQSQLSTPTSIHPQNHYHFQNVSQTLQPPNYLPLQPPSHYHQPQQQQPKIIETKPEPQTQPSQQVPKPKEIERSKKSGGNNNQQLRSPSAKRPLEAPITQQGWLYKQGSDGLMLWKKRWFILSEYCLFYYKSSEEEKLLGSILLPSYKVSICGPEDKVNRKFAFKCEHVNMRTYVLAADSHEVMTQWIKHLNMACLLQNTIEPDSSLSQITVELSNSTLESNLIRYPAQQLSRTTPIHIHSSSNTTDLSASSQNQELNQYPQPLYANAPPKPRRLNDGYLSPSSEILERHMNESKYIPVRQPQRPYNMQQVYMNQNSPKPPINVYGNPHMNVEYFQRDPHLQYINKHIHDSNMPSVNKKENQSIERRTPDTYGRSKLNQAEKINHPSDYEDIYSDQFAYKRPLSPMAYTNNNDRLFNPSMPRQYNPVNVVMRKDRHCINNTQTGIPPNTIPRPHSADFLEYEVKHQLPEIIARQPRPKSSLDINRRSPIDNYFYTEERYAEKMRRSAQYLPKMAKYSARDGNVYEQYEMNGRSKWNQNGSTSSKYNADAISKTDINNDLSLQDYHSIRSRSVLSDGSLSRELDIIENERNQYSNREKAAFLNPYGRNEYDQFTRSASARLSQSNGIDIQYDLRPTSHEGERKREESMKRLLEWKQRMLQSPLNRKVNRGLNNRNVSSGKYDGYNRPSENGYSQMPDEKNLNRVPQYSSYSSDDEASGSISIATRDSFSRNVMPNKAWSSNVRRIQSKSTSNLSNRGYENDYIPQSPGYTLSQGPSQQDLSSDTSQSSIPRRPNNQMDDKMNVSAGELLGRTHEELVLLLIQLRRQSANTFNAIETYYNEIDNIQSRLPKMDASKRLENLQKLEQIKQHLLELEKQYEKGKPLVNLVDNMVKLGSLYKFPKDHTNQLYVKDRLEFNQQMQERRLLAEEKRDWNRLSPNHSELQNKVHQLYQLDQLIQEESETLQGLQQDKEKIEHALGGLRHRLIKGFKSPAEVEQARKQQIALESELSRVHSMLAQNSRKLEETVAGNARLEQELLVLKQKLQISRQHRSSPQISNAGDSLPCVIGTSAMLESDLHRVQQKVGDLQRQRQELSVQVKQLTDRSNNLQQSKLPPSQILSTNKKKIASSWRETDLDTMRKPLYINTVVNQDVDLSLHNNCNMDESSTNSLLPQEKQEIKTVRIVKRESERRQRDREKAVTGKWDAVTEEDDCSQNFTSQTKLSVNNIDCCSSGVLNPSNQNLSTNSANLEDNAEKSSELSPIFKSEAARQIIIEMSTNPQDSVTPKKSNRRLVPKEKRRHHTAPHNNLIMKSLNQLPTTDKDFEKLDMNIRRARDDLDMERALKQRIDTPDVVRSTLSTKDLKYNENTIDNILGTPNKILIPERYIPEQLPQLSAEEEQYRLRKVESIKKMLSDTAIGSLVNLNSDETTSESVSSTANNKSSSTKILEEKKQREHLLQLNQILAKQVMEMSKIVAGSNTHEDLQ